MADLNAGTITGKVKISDEGSASTFDQLTQKVDAFDESFGGMGKTIAEQTAAFFTAEAAIEAVKEAVSAGVEEFKSLIETGSQVASVSDNFDRMSTAAGTTASVLLGSLQSATKGTIDDFSLMKVANQAMAAGLNLTNAQWATLGKGALDLAKATGVDAASALDTMTNSMIKGTTRGVAMLTGKIDLTAAEGQFAQKLGTTTDMLNAEGKVEATREAILSKVGDAVNRIGEQQDTVNEKVEQAGVSWENFQEQLGKTISTSPALLAGMDAISTALTQAFGADKQGLIKTIAGYVDQFALKILDFAKDVSDGVGLAVTEWTNLKIVFDYVAEGILTVTTYALKAELAMEQAAAALHFPGAQQAVTELQASITSVQATTKSWDDDIDKSATEQAKWAQSTGALNDKITAIQGAMTAATAKAAEHQQIVDAVNKSYQGATQATNDNTDALNKNQYVVQQTAAQQKEQAKALKDIADAMAATTNGTYDYQKALATLTADQLANVDAALKAGVAQATIVKAYSLTAEQVKAADDAMKAQTADSAALDKEIQQTLADTGSLGDASVKATSAAATGATMAAGAMDSLAGSVSQATAQVDDLGNAITDVMDNAGKPLTSGQTFAVPTQLTVDTTAGGADALLKQMNALNTLVQSGEYGGGAGVLGMGVNSFYQTAANKAQLSALEQAYTLLAGQATNLKADLAGWEGALPSFAEGGSGDFGSGTLAMLHGPEVITPLSQIQNMGGNANVTIYVNGTAADVARQVSQQIMTTLKQRKQFPAS